MMKVEGICLTVEATPVENPVAHLAQPSPALAATGFPSIPHKITEVNEATEMGFCSACNGRVPLVYRKDKGHWLCLEKRRQVNSKRSAWNTAEGVEVRAVHRISDVNTESRLGTCAVCGPSSALYYAFNTNRNRGHWQCRTAHRGTIDRGRNGSVVKYGAPRTPWDLIQVGYHESHVRVRAQWGTAAQYQCVECSNPAKHWSYDGTDPTELLGQGGPGSWMFYSRFPEFYVPLCISCHMRIDRAKAREELREYRMWKQRTGLTLADV